MMQPASPLEQFRGRFLLSRLILGPRLPPIPHGLILLVNLLLLKLLPATVRLKSREDKHGLNAKFFERAEVRLDARDQSERQATRGGYKRLTRGRVLGELIQIVACIDTKTRIGKKGKRVCLQVLAFSEIIFDGHIYLRGRCREGWRRRMRRCLLAALHCSTSRCRA
ncbi:hypothetical protein K474DRAFT_1048906 [Panus rudis PR-1116 ss-1]|nr:hypothetical protein K474DRAFT_1048906 [Panus rudis PR-1116 ss-1]